MIAGSSAIIAILSFYGLAEIINTVFSSDLQFGEGVCHLPMTTLLQALMITLLVAMISSVFAAWRTTQIEPAEAIRVE
jgi:putative ABC transport system permease protein